MHALPHKLTPVSRSYLGGRVRKAAVHSAVAVVNAELIRERVPSAPVWLPGAMLMHARASGLCCQID
jgi:hypothetical protein